MSESGTKEEAHHKQRVLARAIAIARLSHSALIFISFSECQGGGQHLLHEEKTESETFSDLFFSSLQESLLCLFSNVFFDYVTVNKSLISIFKEICISGHYLLKSGSTLQQLLGGHQEDLLGSYQTYLACFCFSSTFQKCNCFHCDVVVKGQTRVIKKGVRS